MKRDPWSDDPVVAGSVRRISTAAALAERDPGFVGDPIDTFVRVVTSVFLDPVIDGERVWAQPRGGVGLTEITGWALGSWARTNLPTWRRLNDWAAYESAAERFRVSAREREAARLATMPRAQQVAERVAAERQAAARRAELERQRDEAEAALAALDAGRPPVAAVESSDDRPRPGGWLRRP